MMREDVMSDRLRSDIERLLRLAAAPGAAIAMSVDGRLALTAGVGYEDLGQARPLATDARFYAYSISKIFQAVAALRLAEQGRLDLDAPVRAILPEMSLPDAVTVRRLLNHTGGLPDYGALQEYNADLRADPGEPWTDSAFLERTLSKGLLFPPGEGWAYSNVGYLLIRCVVERVTDTSHKEALADLVFRPVGLRQTTMAETLADARDLTPGYSAALDQEGGLSDISRRYHPGWVSHGVAVTTAPDLAHFLDLLFAGRLLRADSLVAMLTATAVPGDHPPFVRAAYGLGLMIDLGSPYGLVAGHAGGGPGYSTAVFHFPDVSGHRVTVAALANRDHPSLGIDIVFALVSAYAAQQFARG